MKAAVRLLAATAAYAAVVVSAPTTVGASCACLTQGQADLFCEGYCQGKEGTSSLAANCETGRLHCICENEGYIIEDPCPQ